MSKRHWMRWMVSSSDNLKSKSGPADQNLKSVGLVALAVAFAMCGARAEARQAKKIPRIGYLTNNDAATESTRSEAFRLALRNLGYIDGQNIAFEYRYVEGKPGQQAELAAELVRLNVDIIVVAGGGAPQIRAAKNATKTIPIVMVGSGSEGVR